MTMFACLHTDRAQEECLQTGIRNTTSSCQQIMSYTCRTRGPARLHTQALAGRHRERPWARRWISAPLSVLWPFCCSDLVCDTMYGDTLGKTGGMNYHSYISPPHCPGQLWPSLPPHYTYTHHMHTPCLHTWRPVPVPAAGEPCPCPSSTWDSEPSFHLLCLCFYCCFSYCCLSCCCFSSAVRSPIVASPSTLHPSPCCRCHTPRSSHASTQYSSIRHATITSHDKTCIAHLLALPVAHDYRLPGPPSLLHMRYGPVRSTTHLPTTRPRSSWAHPPVHAPRCV